MAGWQADLVLHFLGFHDAAQLIQLAWLAVETSAILITKMMYFNPTNSIQLWGAEMIYCLRVHLCICVWVSVCILVQVQNCVYFLWPLFKTSYIRTEMWVNSQSKGVAQQHSTALKSKFGLSLDPVILIHTDKHKHTDEHMNTCVHDRLGCGDLKPACLWCLPVKSGCTT